MTLVSVKLNLCVCVYVCVHVHICAHHIWRQEKPGCPLRVVSWVPYTFVEGKVSQLPELTKLGWPAGEPQGPPAPISTALGLQTHTDMSGILMRGPCAPPDRHSVPNTRFQSC